MGIDNLNLITNGFQIRQQIRLLIRLVRHHSSGCYFIPFHGVQIL